MDADITHRLAKWRRLQAIHMSFVKPSTPSLESSAVENEDLHLPSSFPRSSREEMHLQDLANEELSFRESQVYECILQLRRTAKRLSVHRDFKKKESKTQQDHTRSNMQKKSIELSQETLLCIYNTGRQALLSLANEDSSFESRFPSLTKADLFRKSTVHKRQGGDSHRSDGAIWVTGVSPWDGGPPTGNGLLTHRSSSSNAASSSSVSVDDRMDVVGRREEFRVRNEGGDVGKLWSPMLGMTESEADVWELEGKLLASILLSRGVYSSFRGPCTMVQGMGEYDEVA